MPSTTLIPGTPSLEIRRRFRPLQLSHAHKHAPPTLHVHRRPFLLDRDSLLHLLLGFLVFFGLRDLDRRCLDGGRRAKQYHLRHMNDKPCTQANDACADERGADEHVDGVHRVQNPGDDAVRRHDEDVQDDVGQDEDRREEIQEDGNGRQERVENCDGCSSDERDEGEQCREDLLEKVQEVYDGWFRARCDDR